jgi:hypothetical protein
MERLFASAALNSPVTVGWSGIVDRKMSIKFLNISGWSVFIVLKI